MGHLKYNCTRPRWQGNQYPFVGVSNCEVFVLNVVSVVRECSEGECSEGDSDVYGSVEDSVLLHGYSDRVTPCVKGRLQANIAYWLAEVKAPEPVISIIMQGYVLPFITVPEGKWFKNHSSVCE